MSEENTVVNTETQVNTEGNVLNTPPPADQSNTLLSNEPNETEGKTQTGEDAKPKAEVPQKYEFKAPEGFELDTELVDQFSPLAKELGLSNEQAQKLVDMYGSRIASIQKGQVEAWHNQITGWATEVKADPEIGGKQLDQTIKAAKIALNKYGSDGLKAMMDPPSEKNPNGLGLGNHPEVIRILARIGRSMAEDSGHVRKENTPEIVEKAKLMFPGMN